MLLVGVLYLLFEKSILASKNRSIEEPPLNNITKTILGIQTGLIMLAMVVTRSSVASIQAKRGLPLGNQIVGWLVLSKHAIVVAKQGSIAKTLQLHP